MEISNKDKEYFKKLNILIKEIMRNAKNIQIGKIEKLKGYNGEIFSVRVDEKNRIVFKDNEVNIEIISIEGHYDDK